MIELSFENVPDVLTRAENLPSLPTVAAEVLRLTEDEDSTLDELAGALSRDPALSAKLLRLSNSSLFNLGQEITTLQRATMVLGMKTVKLMSLSFSLAGSLPREGEIAAFDLQEYWRRSLVGAVAARSLSKLVGSRDRDEAFLCGLLGHIGKLVIAQVMPAPYAEVAREAGGWPTAELEEARLGFTSADVSAALLRAWQLPDLVVCAVGFRDRPDALPEGVTDDVRALVRLMRLTSHTESLLCDREKAAPLQAMSRDAARWFDLSEGEIEAFLVGLESGISETAEMLSVRVPADLSHQEIVEKARQQMVNVSLGIAAAGKEAEKKAETDRLTGLPNRAAFDRFLEDQLRERLRGKGTQALGVLLIDIDRFKSVNDTYGHPVGDEVLRMVGGLLARLTRQRAGDMPARYGGEEFAIVAPQSTPFGLRTMAERLRRAIEAETLQVDGRELRVTASFGGACISDVRSMDDGAMLIKIADLHLYKAKEGGRNRSEIHSRVDFPRPG